MSENTLCKSGVKQVWTKPELMVLREGSEAIQLNFGAAGEGTIGGVTSSS